MWEKKIILYNVYFDGVEKTDPKTGNRVLEILLICWGYEKVVSPLRDSSFGCTSPSFFLSSPFSSLPYADLSKQQQTLPRLGGGNGTMKVQSLLYLSIPDGMYWRPKNTVLGSDCNCGFIHWKHNLLPDNSTSSGFGASFAYGFLGTFPGRVHLRVSRCCCAHIGCGQHSGGLKYVGFSPNWTDRSFPTWIHDNVAGSLQWFPAPGVHALV